VIVGYASCFPVNNFPVLKNSLLILKKISLIIKSEINNYLNSQPETKRSDLIKLHQIILKLNPKAKLWFLNGKNEAGKIVSNPNIGYGAYTINYADGSSKEFYRVGLSANTSGISVYIMGLDDKTYLVKTYGKKLGKASVTGYCIKFKALKDINVDTLKDVISYRIKH